MVEEGALPIFNTGKIEKPSDTNQYENAGDQPEERPRRATLPALRPGVDRQLKSFWCAMLFGTARLD